MVRGPTPTFLLVAIRGGDLTNFLPKWGFLRARRVSSLITNTGHLTHRSILSFLYRYICTSMLWPELVAPAPGGVLVGFNGQAMRRLHCEKIFRERGSHIASLALQT